MHKTTKFTYFVNCFVNSPRRHHCDDIDNISKKPLIA